MDLNGPVDYNSPFDAIWGRDFGQVNFAAGRVRPNFSLDAAAGATLFHKEEKEISLQLEANNLTNRVNVMNFASLFSGTAVGPPRSVSARLKLGF